MINIILCSDSFKGTLSSSDIAKIGKDLVDSKYKDKVKLTTLLIADGGEGSLEAFSSFLEGENIFVDTIDAEYRKINVNYFLSKENIAIIEISKIIGLPMIKNTIKNTKRTTRGIGIVIKDAIKRGAKTVYICLGGTSTVDFGIGMLEELGLKIDKKRDLCSEDLISIDDYDDKELLNNIRGVTFIGLSDVNNPLTGKYGASYTFGPQKGFKRQELFNIEKGMINISNIIKRKKNIDLSTYRGSGAAGGIGGAICSILNGTLKSGIDTLLELADFKNLVKENDIVITGEGSFDSQSLNGKVISGILKYVNKDKLVIICGRNKIEDSNIKIIETSNGISDMKYIKLHAKEMYQAALDKYLEDIV